jgi:hypothetical protein
VPYRVLNPARQPYSRWPPQPVTHADHEAGYRANALFDAHCDNPEFGYRFVVDEAREAGEQMAERTAWKVCSDLGWWSAFGKKRGKNGKRPGPPAHDDLVSRDFTAVEPNQLWLSDITEHPTGEGKLYLLPSRGIFDAHTHIGQHDPSGFTACLDELRESLDAIDARAAVFPLTEPGGYRQANLACVEAAAQSEHRLAAVVRLTREESPDRLLQEGLSAGARGIKLHLTSDRFEIDDPRLRDVYEIADHRRLPVIVHAGPEGH